MCIRDRILNVHENIVLPVELDGDTVDQKFMADVVSMLGPVSYTHLGTKRDQSVGGLPI